MENELAVYVSAAHEMDAECELLGQLLADMPKSIKWVIKRTPGPYERGNPDIEALRRSQFHLILLGLDVTAPIGVEWRAAQEAGLAAFGFRNTGRTPSPAASVFVRDSGMSWQDYQTPLEFIRAFERALIGQLIEGTPGYGLGLKEIEELSQRLASLDEGAEKPDDEERRGAGRGGIIFASR